MSCDPHDIVEATTRKEAPEHLFWRPLHLLSASERVGKTSRANALGSWPDGSYKVQTHETPPAPGHEGTESVSQCDSGVGISTHDNVIPRERGSDPSQSPACPHTSPVQSCPTSKSFGSWTFAPAHPDSKGAARNEDGPKLKVKPRNNQRYLQPGN